MKIIKIVRMISFLIIFLIIGNSSLVNAEELTKKKEEVKRIEKEYRETKAELQKLDDESNELRIELANLVEELEEYDLQVERKEKSINSLKNELNEKKKTLGERLKIMYVNGQVGYLEMLLTSTSNSEFLSRYEAAKFIVEHDKEMLEDIEMITREIENENISLKLKRDSIDEMKEQLKKEQEKIDELTEEKQELTRRLAEDKENTEKDIERIYEQIRRDMNVAKGNLNSNFKYSGGSMLYPVPGHTRISSDYGNRIHPISNRQSFHTGIDIPAPMGARVVAAEDGIVSTSSWLGGYGKTVIILHNNTISTLYGHNSQLLVSPGDIVKKGDLIARIGTTGNSTGPHLHFEVRKNGQHQNPNSFLR